MIKFELIVETCLSIHFFLLRLLPTTLEVPWTSPYLPLCRTLWRLSQLRVVAMSVSCSFGPLLLLSPRQCTPHIRTLQLQQQLGRRPSSWCAATLSTVARATF
jgi:hypothetical protein|eukprot:COSAG06_NODE_12054_length_1429_cov_1.279699_1_plen_103_part_00